MSDNNIRLVIKTDRQRIQDMVTVDEFLGSQSGDMTSTIAIVSKCMWNEEMGQYYDVKEARKFLGSLTITHLMELVRTVNKEITDIAIPPQLEDVSD